MQWRNLVFAVAFAVLGGCTQAPVDWALNDVTGHLPDLEFELIGDNGKPINEDAFAGKVVILFFGFAHCPDVCPLTMSRLHRALVEVGDAAKDVRIAFVSVDPKRDTPEILHRYVRAFDKRAVGMTGTPTQLRDMTKRYRAVFDLEEPDASGNYAVSHSAAIYLFDREGNARLLGTANAGVADIAHDLSLLLKEPSA